MKLSILWTLLFFSNIACSQYEPLQSSGDIPKDLTTPSFKKYQQELENVDSSAKRRTRKNQKEFFLESNYGIDDLLKSGYVLFNDPVTNYVNEIAAILLKDDPKLKKELRFYVVRSASVNAFATGQGIVLVNMGLIAQLKNEAQLAFILAHEISHYKEKHALEFFLTSKEIDRKNKRGFLRRRDFDTTLAKNQFSKEQESEADELGLELFLKSKYNLDAVDGAFDVLQFSYLPFAQTPFNKSFFEDDYLIFAPNYQLDSINAISLEANEDDTESTHPSLPKRRIAASKIISEYDNNGRMDFVISKSRFESLQKKARYELLEYHLRNYEYYDAIYNSYLLQQDFPEDIYLKKVTAKALYGMTKFINARAFSDFEYNESEIEGEFGSLVYFLNKLEKYELNALTLRYAYLLKDQFANDVVFQDMIKDICQDFINKHSGPFKRFKEGRPSKSPPPPLKKPAPNASEEEKKKYKEIKEKRKENSRFVYYAFGDLLAQQDFHNLITECKNEKKKRKKEEAEDAEFWSPSPSNYYSKGGFALGEKKILAINPYYLKLKKGFKAPYLIQTEKAQNNFNNTITKNANRLNLKVIMLDAKNFSKKEVEAYNDLRDLQEWFGHQMEMGEELSMIAFNQERVNAIAKKYKVDSFLWAGVVSGKVPKSMFETFGKLIFNQLSWVYGIASPKGESIIFSIVLDSNSGKAKMATFDLVEYIDHKDIINQRVYDILGQIKKRK